MDSTKTNEATSVPAATLPAGQLRGESAQTCSRLTEQNRKELEHFAHEKMAMYRQHINKEIFDEILESMLDLYGAIVKKDGDGVLVYYRIEASPLRNVQMIQVNLAGPLKQESHISVISDYGGDMSVLQDKISTVNDEMINELAHTLQTTPVIEKRLRKFILKVLDLLPDYVPYHYTTVDEYTLFHERLAFVNFNTGHTVLISVAPYRMCWNIVNQEACNNITAQTVMQ